MDDQTTKRISDLCQTELKVQKHVDSLKALNTGQLAASLTTAKNQYRVLKMQFMKHQTRLLLYEMLEGDQSMGLQEIEEELKSTCEEIRGYQADIQNSKNDIEKLSEQLQNALGSYKVKKELLERRLQEVQEKKAKFEHEAAEKGCMKYENLGQMDMALERVRHELRHLTAAEKTWGEELESLRRVRVTLEETEHSARQMLHDTEERKAQLLETNRVGKLKCEQLATLHGIEHIQFKDNTLQVMYKPQGNGVGMQLSVKFVEEGEHRIKSAFVEPSGVVIEDIVEQAQETNDVVYLVSAISSRWQQSHRLISEIEQLRNEYALDWRHSDRVLQVLYGEVVCSLHVDNSYPSPKSVRLLSINGSDRNIDSSPDKTTLTDWLKYIEAEVRS